jgi:hypothetical protein
MQIPYIAKILVLYATHLTSSTWLICKGKRIILLLLFAECRTEVFQTVIRTYTANIISYPSAIFRLLLVLLQPSFHLKEQNEESSISSFRRWEIPLQASYIILSNARWTAWWSKKSTLDFSMLYGGFKLMLLPFLNYGTPICQAIW